MKRLWIGSTVALGTIALGTGFWVKPRVNWPGVRFVDGSSLLANGDRIRPVGRVHIPLHGDMPLSITTALDGVHCLVVTGGYHDHGVALVNLHDENSDTFVPTTKCSGGLATIDAENSLIAAGDLGIRSVRATSDQDNWFATPYHFGKNAWVQSVAVLPGKRVVATDINNDEIRCFEIGTPDPVWVTKIGHKPNRITVDSQHSGIYVTNWGGSSVSILGFDGSGFRQVSVGSQPSDICIAKDSTVYVSNSGSNSVSVIQKEAVIATVFTSLTANDLVGTCPSGLGLSRDNRHLYVANSGSNNIALIDVASPVRPKVEGFIPTGWYPTVVYATPDGRRLLVGTAKGLGASANFPGIKPEQTLTDDYRNLYDYLPNRLEGDLMIVDLPAPKQLKLYTQQCIANSRREITQLQESKERELLPTLRQTKHVLYIIRENRSYDQVLGDLKGTNAEPNLCMYGEKITPNGHKIAKTFKTFDNLYCDGEVSQDGHEWCCASYCTDFTEKVWPTGYADRGRPDEDESVVASPAGYLWDNCRKHGLSYRSYGEFASFKSNRGSAPVYEGVSGLANFASKEWSLSKGRDKDRVSVFIDEMKRSEKSGNWWNFMVMSLGEDHTAGRTPGDFTPFSKVASNDVGLGRLVDAITHSKFWKDTAIFVIEDDAQDGPDHVDGHRTVGYVISPYIKRGGVDHTMYSTASMVRTMELMLGLPPMTLHDRHAASMLESFTKQVNLIPFKYEAARIDLSAKNPKVGKLAEESKKLNFSEYDRADPQKLNRILWEDAKPGTHYPTVSHLAR